MVVFLSLYEGFLQDAGCGVWGDLGGGGEDVLTPSEQH